MDPPAFERRPDQPAGAVGNVNDDTDHERPGCSLSSSQHRRPRQGHRRRRCTTETAPGDRIGAECHVRLRKRRGDPAPAKGRRFLRGRDDLEAQLIHRIRSSLSTPEQIAKPTNRAWDAVPRTVTVPGSALKQAPSRPAAVHAATQSTCAHTRDRLHDRRPVDEDVGT